MVSFLFDKTATGAIHRKKKVIGKYITTYVYKLNARLTFIILYLYMHFAPVLNLSLK